MVDKKRQKRIQILLREIISDFVLKEALRKSLITITRVDILPNLSRAKVYISVLPEDKENEALHFMRRKSKEIREYVKQNTLLRKIPFIEIEIDKGEKNRQALEKLNIED